MQKTPWKTLKNYREISIWIFDFKFGFTYCDTTTKTVYASNSQTINTPLQTMEEGTMTELI